MLICKLCFISDVVFYFSNSSQSNQFSSSMGDSLQGVPAFSAAQVHAPTAILRDSGGAKAPQAAFNVFVSMLSLIRDHNFDGDESEDVVVSKSSSQRLSGGNLQIDFKQLGDSLGRLNNCSALLS